MVINILNQNTNKFNSFPNSSFSSLFGNNTSTYYAKKGEPTYQKDMDKDDDGIVTFDDFREYCKENGISNSDMAKMLELRMTYQMTKDVTNQVSKKSKTEKEEETEYKPGNLELIYAEENDGNYDESMDTDGDSKISYKEYLRYCEQNAKPEAKNSDTKIRENDNKKFMTISYGKISNAYNKVETEAPEGKVISIV